MSFKIQIQKLVEQPWFIAFLLILIFFSINGYKYGWDDQHLEIPLLKSLIDDSLYQGDYYVESLKENFSSYFYHLLAKIISVDQIETTYLILYVLSRYFLIFWIYKLWLLITENKLKASICTVTFMVLLRVSEFLYRTFSHQEFALAIIFAGIYYFFKERFLLASIIFGVSANFHALYSFFPFVYMITYLLWDHKKHGIKIILKSVLSFTIAFLPFFIWIIQNRFLADGGGRAYDPNWLGLYQIASPQNFLLPLLPLKLVFTNIYVFFNATQSFLIIIIFFIINMTFNKSFRQNKKALAFCIAGFGLLGVCFLFSNVIPIRFFIDLNLKRNEQYLLFMLGGFLSILFMDIAENKKFFIAFCFAILFTLLKFGKMIATPAAALIFLLLLYDHWLAKPKSIPKFIILILILAASFPCIRTIYRAYEIIPHKFVTMLTLTTIWLLLSFLYFTHFSFKNGPRERLLRQLLFIIPICAYLVQYSYYRYERNWMESNNRGFWKLYRSWQDMQNYVKLNTPIDATIMTPYDLDMDNFRTFSEREVVVSERDLGIVGFDYNAAVEAGKRIHDLKSYTTGISEPISDALQAGIFKYKTDYIVFMRYAAPKNSALFKRIYTNLDLVLYKVTLPRSIIEKVSSKK